MPDRPPHFESPQPSDPPPRLLTFASGGWVLLLSGLICLGLISWAVAPAVMRTFNRPLGDGRSIESYGFDLSNLSVPRELVVPATLYRDLIPVMTAPTTSGPDVSAENHADRWRAMQRRNDPKYGKYLVGNDRVIGVVIDGEARAYPLHVMYVHEIVNDTLGPAGSEVPIAVTYNMPSDSIVVFDRRVNGEWRIFRTSGLVYNSNLLMYDALDGSPVESSRRLAGGTVEEQDESSSPHVESLWSQLLALAVSGPKEGRELTVIPAELATWADWSRRYPDTTVLDRDLRIAARYRKSAPTQYFNSPELLFPVHPLPTSAGLPGKTHVVAVQAGDARRVYPMPYLVTRARAADTREGELETIWSDTLGEKTLRFIFDPTMHAVRVEAEPPTAPLRVTHTFWFAWHAMSPGDELAGGAMGQATAGAP